MHYYNVTIRPINGNTAKENETLSVRADNKMKAHRLAEDHIRPKSLLDAAQWHVVMVERVNLA